MWHQSWKIFTQLLKHIDSIHQLVKHNKMAINSHWNREQLKKLGGRPKTSQCGHGSHHDVSVIPLPTHLSPRRRPTRSHSLETMTVGPSSGWQSSVLLAWWRSARRCGNAHHHCENTEIHFSPWTLPKLWFWSQNTQIKQKIITHNYTMIIIVITHILIMISLIYHKINIIFIILTLLNMNINNSDFTCNWTWISTVK